MSTEQDSQGTSTRPYLIRALHDWCTDNGFTPYLAVYVDRSVQVPLEYVKNNEIVLNVSFEATSQLQLGNEFIEFKARFGGVARDISVPVDHVIAIYARENGQGMAFPVPTPAGGDATDAPASAVQDIDDAGVPEPVMAEVPRRTGGGLRLAPQAQAADSGKGSRPSTESTEGADNEPTPDGPGGGGRPTLRRIK